jgi:hypothetical protein
LADEVMNLFIRSVLAISFGSAIVYVLVWALNASGPIQDGSSPLGAAIVGAVVFSISTLAMAVRRDR